MHILNPSVTPYSGQIYSIHFGLYSYKIINKTQTCNSADLFRQMKVYPNLQTAVWILFYIALRFSFTSIPPNIRLKTFLSVAVSRLAISSFSIQDSAPYVATGLNNVLQNFILFFIYFIFIFYFIYFYLFICLFIFLLWVLIGSLHSTSYNTYNRLLHSPLNSS